MAWLRIALASCSVHSSLQHDVNKLRTWSAAVNRSLRRTFNAVALWRYLRCATSFAHGSQHYLLCLGAVSLSRKLFLLAQSLTCETSVTHISLFSAGTITYVSSANLTTLLTLCTGLGSATVTRYFVGPRPDPCITLAWIFAHVDIFPEYFVQCERS